MGNTLTDFKGGNNFYRDRVKTEIYGSGIAQAWYGSIPSKYTGNVYSAGEFSRIVDANNPGWYRWRRYIEDLRKHDRELYLKRRNINIDGPFMKESVKVTMPTSGSVKQGSGIYQNGYQGLFFPSTDYNVAMLNLTKGKFPSIPSTLGTDRVTLWSLGSTAIKKSLPDIPEFSLFRFAGELREGLPKVPLKALMKEKKLRATGGEYLNYQFGIAPLVSDLQNFLEALSHPKFRDAVEKHLDDEFRVRKVLEKDSTTTRRSMTYSEMATDPQAGGTGYVTQVDSRRIWSSCSFAYHQVSELDRLLRDLDNMTGGLGVVPTAIDLWNLIPWSWLVDWFTNFNHVITNLSYLGRDGLYLRRGYIMGTFTTSAQYERSGMAYGSPFFTSGTISSERKYRVEASPFGFGYTWKDFNPFQLSILGALGVNRLRF